MIKMLTILFNVASHIGTISSNIIFDLSFDYILSNVFIL